MVVITDQNDLVVDFALIPGLHADIPVRGHLYFPVKEALPKIGDHFIPDFETQPWLKPE